jgi:hypothetical protein
MEFNTSKLASVLGVTQGTVTRKLRNPDLFNVGELSRVAAYAGMAITSLFGGAQDTGGLSSKAERVAQWLLREENKELLEAMLALEGTLNPDNVRSAATIINSLVQARPGPKARRSRRG